MKASTTHTITRLAVTMCAAVAAMVSVPAAGAFDGPPDAIDRYRSNHAGGDTTLALGGSPDAIDRYQRANTPVLATPAIQGSPDAIDRYERGNAPVLTTPAIQGSPDALDRYAGKTVVVSAQTASGFSWGDFGIGAAAMFGLVLVLAGLGMGVYAARHRTGRIRIS